MKKILIATDGSEYSRAAIEKLCDIVAPSKGLEIKVTSVAQNVYVPAGEPFVVPPEYLQEIADAARKQAEHFVEKAAKLIRERLGDVVELTEEVVVGGEPEQQILEEAERWKPDLIVVGSHGRGFWGRMLGSVSNAVVHQAHCSVLVGRQDHRQ